MNIKIRQKLSAQIIEARDILEKIHTDRKPSKERDRIFQAIIYLNSANNVLFVEDGISEDCKQWGPNK